MRLKRGPNHKISFLLHIPAYQAWRLGKWEIQHEDLTLSIYSLDTVDSHVKTCQHSSSSPPESTRRYQCTLQLKMLSSFSFSHSLHLVHSVGTNSVRGDEASFDGPSVASLQTPVFVFRHWLVCMMVAA